MSRRHPEANSRQQTANSKKTLPAVCCLLSAVCCLDLNIANAHCSQRIHELHRFVMLKLRIVGLDYEEEFVARCQREIWRVENRMVRLRQFVEQQHSKH